MGPPYGLKNDPSLKMDKEVFYFINKGGTSSRGGIPFSQVAGSQFDLISVYIKF
jgi:hypothetical protein